MGLGGLGILHTALNDNVPVEYLLLSLISSVFVDEKPSKEKGGITTPGACRALLSGLRAAFLGKLEGDGIPELGKMLETVLHRRTMVRIFRGGCSPTQGSRAVFSSPERAAGWEEGESPESGVSMVVTKSPKSPKSSDAIRLLLLS